MALPYEIFWDKEDPPHENRNGEEQATKQRRQLTLCEFYILMQRSNGKKSSWYIRINLAVGPYAVDVGH